MENRIAHDRHCNSIKIGDTGLAGIFEVTGKKEHGLYAKRFEVVGIGNEEHMRTITLLDENEDIYKVIACWFTWAKKDRPGK